MLQRTLLTASLLCVATVFCHSATADDASRNAVDAYVRVSQADPRYFELTNGQPFIPIGMNVCWPRFEEDEEQVFATLEKRFAKLSDGGGNYVRIFMSHPFYEVEHERSGEYDAHKLQRLKRLFALARKYGIRVKLCLDHFRTLKESKVRFPGSISFGNPLQHVDQGGPAATMDEYFQSEKSRAQFKRKLHWLGEQIGDEPTIFAWELWNEINSVRGTGWIPWTEEMLKELHTVFPKNMATQNLGSLDRESKLELYNKIWQIPQNDFAQVHRYLDQGAPWEVCRGPMDILGADAIRQYSTFQLAKPILLAECGAVEPHHAAPSKLYEIDREGVLLHDLLFAPFFAGSAGCGQSWHWYFYVDKHDLWHHFGRFAAAVRGIDPGREHFQPELIDHPRLRVYVLKGKTTTLAWCRDKQSDWNSELLEKQPAVPLVDVAFPTTGLGKPDARTVEAYAPWEDQGTTVAIDDNSITLPRFTRSLVLRLR